MAETKVEIIEPIYQRANNMKKLNVCAYARVSTGADEQKDSFINQQRYYEDMIKNNPSYNFVGVFADEAISGTTDKRPDFQRMINLAEHDYIDVIYTKSISRFSRNVADLLTYCESLRNHNVNVIFEENNIELLNSAGSLMLTILGAIAQMEVENTSDHVNWTLRNKMEKGEFVGQPNPLGYDVVDNRLVINEEEAKTVRYIFQRYLEGIGGSTIAKELEQMGAKTKRGNTKWNNTTILGIIKNEKYTGLLVQGKTFTVNPIGHKRKDNTGDSRLYKVPDNHEAIITLEDWNKAQEILNSRCVSYSDGRKRGTTHNANLNVFTSKLVCAYCGKNYVRRKIHAGTKYEKVIWNCSSYCKQGKASCPKCKAIEEDFIKSSVVGMIKNLIDDNDGMFYLSNEQLNALLKQSEKNKNKIEEQIIKCNNNIKAKNKKKSKLLDMFLDDVITEDVFKLRSAEIEKEIESARELLNELHSLTNYEDVKSDTNRQISRLINEGKAEGFNKELFNLIIDKIVIGGKRSDGVDDPESLHFQLNAYNLDTDLTKKVDKNGVLHYTMNCDMDEAIAQYGDDSSLCSLDKDSACGVRGADVKR
ncbi:MAG: recombinase family protein [Ruminococcus sp.]|nr:recombinase family protein [Ruminococcus sp.]